MRPNTDVKENNAVIAPAAPSRHARACVVGRSSASIAASAINSATATSSEYCLAVAEYSISEGLIAHNASTQAEKGHDSTLRDTNQHSHNEARPQTSGSVRNAYSLVPNSVRNAFSARRNPGGATCA